MDGLVRRDDPLPMPLTMMGDCGAGIFEGMGRDVEELSSSSSLDPVYKIILSFNEDIPERKISPVEKIVHYERVTTVWDNNTMRYSSACISFLRNCILYTNLDIDQVGVLMDRNRLE